MRSVLGATWQLEDGKNVMIEECAGEEFRRGDGKFIKWNNNGDMINDREKEYPGGIDPCTRTLPHAGGGCP